MNIIREPIERQAVRMLFIIRYCGVGQKQRALFGPQYVIESEKKLQKIQFWVRNPDYLADALLNEYNKVKIDVHKDVIKTTIHKIYQDREPIIRSTPMQRYFYGAYEPLDRVMALLISKRLVSGRRQPTGHHKVHYYLTPEGQSLIKTMLAECPETHWYKERCQLIYSFWGQLSGNEIGGLQYSNQVYNSTSISEMLHPVTTLVKQKYKDIFGEDLSDDET
jgi:hypothetical protein